MEPITLGELEEATGAALIGAQQDKSIRITGAVSDNRIVRPGEVFFAYVGEKLDAHRFVSSALAQGAGGCVISRGPEEVLPDKFYCLVPDTMLAAGDLARYYRRKFRIPLTAVTGSVGKTTTKDMIAAALSVRYQTLKTEGNLNNNIGVPRTLLRLDSRTEAAVVEMGMNHLGEIEYLTGIGQPTAAAITNIGTAHIGILGSRENIFRAKCEIFKGLRDGAAVYLNGDDEYLTLLRDCVAGAPAPDRDGLNEWLPGLLELIREKKIRLIMVGEGADCDLRAEDIQDQSASELCFTAVTGRGTVPVTVPSPGRHMIYPALTAMAAALELGISPEKAAAGIAGYQATKMRMETHQLPGGVTLLNDTYNANPQSMMAALTTLAHTDAGVKVAVLGDMFELGAMEDKLHREVGEFAAALPIDILITVGNAANYLADSAKKAGNSMRVLHCTDKKEAENALSGLVQKDTAFLCKASRGMALEELSRFIMDKAAGIEQET